jgi:peptidylprolyl isomerase
MKQAKSGDTVRIHYTGRLQDGSEFDSSQGGEPLEFKIGDKAIIPALEEAIIGLEVGESGDIEIASVDAYGARFEEAVQQIERSEIPDEVEIIVGGHLQATAPNGEQMMLMVTELTDTHVTLDANHPLADQDLHFTYELIAIV